MAYETGLSNRAILVAAAGLMAVTVAVHTSLSQDLPSNTPPSTTPLLRASVAVDKVDDTAPTPDADLARTEDKLRQMEAELLKTLNSQNTHAITETPKGSAVSKMKMPPVEPPKDLDTEISAPQDEPSGAAAMLKQLEDHPALGGGSRDQSSGTRDRANKTDRGIDLTQKLAIAESQVSILSRELDTTRRSLRSAEKRIEELSALVRETANRPNDSIRDLGENQFDSESPIARGQGDDSDVAPYWPGSHTVPIVGNEGDSLDAPLQRHSSDSAFVAVDKAPLRIGPGRLESTLFMMPRNTQLQIERRSGEWYRVVTSSGTRGWVFGSALLFGQGASSESAVRIGAVHTAYEPTGLRY
jgi:hypothetical protein